MKVSPPEWPKPLAEEAFYGLAGEVVRTIEPHSEADPAALLLQFLVVAGNVVGRVPYFMAESDRHYCNLFATIVGATSKSRKGTSLGHIKRIFVGVDEEWVRNAMQAGLSSGEGLIHAVRDGDGEDDPGVKDKRLMVTETEFASPLRVLARDGNTLSPVLRRGWDGDTLQVMNKNSPEIATGAHISIIAHVTRDELRHEMSRIDGANGFANRFLWSLTRRSKCLPDGGSLSDAEIRPLAGAVRETVSWASSFDDFELKRDRHARELWHEVYPTLSEGKPGLFGAVIARAEAQVMRLACIYAILESATEIRSHHLTAALAVWECCESSAKYIWGDTIGHPLADEIRRMLLEFGNGLTRTEITNRLGRNRKSAEITTALSLLAEYGLATCVNEPTEGRNAERWFAQEHIASSRPDAGIEDEQPAEQLNSSSSFNSYPADAGDGGD